MNISIDIKHLFFLTLGFMAFTPIGTVSHEFGHIIVAKSLGYETTLHYGSMNYKKPILYEKLTKIYNENKTAIKNKTNFKEKIEFEEGIRKRHSNELLITIGGPLQTILTGVLGLFTLFFRRNKIKRYGMKLIDWLAVFLSLFWLREIFNLVMSVSKEIFYPNGSYFGGDEKKISEILNLWPGTISSISGLLGLAIFVFVVLKIVPNQLKLTFLTSAFLGGTLGFVLWMNILGPKILP